MKAVKDLFRRRTTTRLHLSAQSSPSVPPVCDALNDVEEDEIDYSFCIQQELTGIRLQNKERLMIEEMRKSLLEWSGKHKKWCKKWNQAMREKGAYHQSYTTTLNVFLAAISDLNQVAVQFENKNKELNTILRDLSKPADSSVKLEIEQENSKLNAAKDILDTLEKRKKEVKNNLSGTRKRLQNCQPNTQKQVKLQESQRALEQERKELNKEITTEKGRYRQAQKLHRDNMENIYKQSQQKEFTRLANMGKPLMRFVKALEIEPIALEKAVNNHNSEADLVSWQEKYFSPTLNQTTA